MKDYGKVARLLTDCFRKGNFFWDEVAEQAFQSLKWAMTNLSLLALSDFSREFIVETDASGQGLGAVLLQ